MSTDSPAWFQRAIDFPSEHGSVEVDGVSISYVAWGEVGKPGIILIHGSNAHLEWWRFVAPFLADQFRVAAIDLSGNGDSGWRETYSGAELAAETMAVCEAAELGERPFVLGHSFGGFVALQTAYAHGADLGGMIMIDFTVSPPGAHSEWGMRAQKREEAAAKGREKTEDEKRSQARGFNHGRGRPLRRYDTLEEALPRFRLLPDQPNRYPEVLDYIGRKSLKQLEDGKWTWKFDPSFFEHLEMGRDQRDKFLDIKCRAAVILAEDSRDDGANAAPYMAEITGGVLPIFTIPTTHHHMMFEEPLALATAFKGIVLAWIQEDQRDQMQAALADVERL